MDDLPQSLRAHFERQAERNNQEGAPGGYLGLKDPRKSFVAFMATRFEASNPKGEILPELGQDEEGVGKKVLKSINYDRASAEVKAGLDKSREAERGKYETFNAAVPIAGEEKERLVAEGHTIIPSQWVDTDKNEHFRGHG